MRAARLVIPAVLVLPGACGGAEAAPPDLAVRHDSAGIEIVENPGPDRAAGWRFEEVARFAPGLDDTLELPDARGLDAAVDGAGQVFLALGSWPRSQVARLDLSSGAVTPVGRKGGGPGEYQMVGDLTASAGGTLTVMDYGKQAFVRFAPDGTALPEVSWTGFTALGRPVGVAAAGEALVLDLGWYADSATWRRVAVATAADTSVLLESSEPRGEMVTFADCGVSFAMPPLFTPGMVWNAGGGFVAVAHDSAYDVRVARDGATTRRVRRPTARVEASEAVAVRDLGEGTRVGVAGRPTCTIPPETIVRERGFAPWLPVLRRLALAPDGTLWVGRWAPRGDPAATDLFDASGAYLGSLAGDHPWPLAFFPDGDLLAADTDSLGLPALVRHRVVRAGP